MTLSQISLDVHRDAIGERTYARVTATTEFSDCRELLPRLIRAVTAWVKDGGEGAVCWENSCEDLNLGDLALCETSVESPLGQHLAREGVFDLRIEVNSSAAGDPNWTFDTVLVDRTDLDED